MSHDQVHLGLHHLNQCFHPLVISCASFSQAVVIVIVDVTDAVEGIAPTESVLGTEGGCGGRKFLACLALWQAARR